MKPSVVELIEDAAEAWELWMIAILRAGTQQFDNKESRKLLRRDFIDAMIELSEEAERDPLQGHGGRDA